MPVEWIARLRPRFKAAASVLKRAFPHLLSGLLLAAAALPSWFVIQDIWLGEGKIALAFKELWCRYDFLCELRLPSYFLIIFAVFLALPLVFLICRACRAALPLQDLAEPETPTTPANPGRWQTTAGVLLILGSMGLMAMMVFWATMNDRIAGISYAGVYGAFVVGWLMLDQALSGHWHNLRREFWPLTLSLLFHLSTVVLISGLYTRIHPILLILACGLYLVSLIVLRRKFNRLSTGLILVTLALIFFLYQINAWWFAIIGDEYAFLRYGQLILDSPVSFVVEKAFDGTGVYGSHPFFSSMLQALSLKIFGYSNYGWRFSSLYLAALAVGLLYLWLRAHVSKRAAFMGGLLLAGSSYLMSFGKIGYNNLQALFALTLVLASSAWAVRKRTQLAYILLGVVTGLCFYLYPAALYVAPLGFLYLLFYDPPVDRDALQRWLLAVVALLFLIFPLIPQRDYWMQKIAGTVLYTPDILGSSSSASHHFSENAIYSLVSFLYHVQPSHFVANAFLDPVSSIFLILGGALTLVVGWRRRVSLFVLLSFAFTLIVVGVTHDRPQPPVTRMFLLLPWYVTLTAFGLEWLMARLAALGLGQRIRTGILGALLVSILAVNLYQAYPLSKKLSADHYQSLQVLFLREAVELSAAGRALPSSITFLNHERTFVVESLRELLQLYGVQIPLDILREFDFEGGGLPDDQLQAFADERSLVIIVPWLNPDEHSMLSQALITLGMIPCEVKNTNQLFRFEIWHHPSFDLDCE